jgi:hypothetical protein
MGKLGVFEGGSIAAHVDGIHDGEGAADSEDEAEEDADQRAGGKFHDAVMVCLGLRRITVKAAYGAAANDRLDQGRGWCGEDALRDRMLVMMAYREVASVEVDEEVGQAKDRDHDYARDRDD